MHPRQQLERELTPDRDTVMMCWGPVHAVLDDLAVVFSGDEVVALLSVRIWRESGRARLLDEPVRSLNVTALRTCVAVGTTALTSRKKLITRSAGRAAFAKYRRLSGIRDKIQR